MPAIDLPESAALLDALASVAELLRDDEVAGRWNDPSTVERYSVGGVAGHLCQACERLVDVLDAPAPDGEPLLDLSAWFGQNRVASDADLDESIATWLRETGEAKAQVGAAALADTLNSLTTTIAERLAVERVERTVVSVRTPTRPIPLVDYVASRVVEVVIHGDDVAHAAGVAWEPPPGAAALASEFLLRMARDRSGDLAVLRALARAERVDDPADVLRGL